MTLLFLKSIMHIVSFLLTFIKNKGEYIMVSKVTKNSSALIFSFLFNKEDYK